MSHYNRKDHFWVKAKGEGYRSRAAYKLIQLQKQHKIFREGDRVVDLGCSPGGWIQVIVKEIGPGGKVVGLDRTYLNPLPAANVSFVQGDIYSEHARQEIIDHLNGLADVITSDMAPDLSGVRFRDHHLSCELVIAGLDFCEEILRQGGTFLAKAFEGEELGDLYSNLRQRFKNVKRVTPEASRKGSSEFYFLARGFRLH